MSILSDKEITLLCKNNPPLINNFQNWDNQLQPSGFDLTIENIFYNTSAGKIYSLIGTNESPIKTDVTKSDDGFFLLDYGYYIILLNEIICLPNNIAGIGHPRSTVLRYGAILTSGLWDAGFHGKSHVGLFVANKAGIVLQEKVMIMQMSFHTLTSVSKGFQYNYLYHEGLDSIKSDDKKI